MNRMICVVWLLMAFLAIAQVPTLESAIASKARHSKNQPGTQTLFYNPQNGHVFYRGRFEVKDRPGLYWVDLRFEVKKGKQWHQLKDFPRNLKYIPYRDWDSFGLKGRLSSKEKRILRQKGEETRLRGRLLRRDFISGDMYSFSKITLKPVPTVIKGRITTVINPGR